LVFIFAFYLYIAILRRHVLKLFFCCREFDLENQAETEANLSLLQEELKEIKLTKHNGNLQKKDILTLLPIVFKHQLVNSESIFTASVEKERKNYSANKNWLAHEQF
jgi:hypothetical protein